MSSIHLLRGRLPLTIHTCSRPFVESKLSNDSECGGACIPERHSILPVVVAQDDFRAVGEGRGNNTQKLLHDKLSTLPVSYVIIPTQKADRNREGSEFMKKTPAVKRQRQHIFIHQKSGAVSLSPEPLQQGSPSRGFIGYTRSGKGEIGTFRYICSAVGAKKDGLEHR